MLLYLLIHCIFPTELRLFDSYQKHGKDHLDVLLSSQIQQAQVLTCNLFSARCPLLSSLFPHHIGSKSRQGQEICLNYLYMLSTQAVLVHRRCSIACSINRFKSHLPLFSLLHPCCILSLQSLYHLCFTIWVPNNQIWPIWSGCNLFQIFMEKTKNKNV